MNNSQVAHAWAAQSRDSASGSHFYFEGRTIYSYGPHFPIASFTDATDENGARIVLFTTGSYSMTTAQHMNKAWSALYGLNVRTIRVPNVSAGEYASQHGDNMRHFVAAYDELLKKAARARTNGERYLSEAAEIASDGTSYARAFQLEIPVFLAPTPEFIEGVRAAARIEAKANAKRNAERKAREARSAAERAEFIAQRVAEWKAGANTSIPGDYYGETLLRRVKNRVETSRGAEVTIKAARQLFTLVNSVRNATGETRALACETAPRIDDFELRGIEESGIVVGCHRLSWPVIDAFANAQGWTQ